MQLYNAELYGRDSIWLVIYSDERDDGDSGVETDMEDELEIDLEAFWAECRDE